MPGKILLKTFIMIWGDHIFLNLIFNPWIKNKSLILNKKNKKRIKSFKKYSGQPITMSSSERDITRHISSKRFKGESNGQKQQQNPIN
jgi:hypothetical protein